MDIKIGPTQPGRITLNIPEIMAPEYREAVLHEFNHRADALLPVNALEGIFLGVLKGSPGRMVKINVPPGGIAFEHILDVTNLLFLRPHMPALEVGV
jgi:hypothetical protein